MLTIHKHILPKSAARPIIKLRKFSGITIHETGNTNIGANAASHDKYLHINGGKNHQVSYHYVVDEKEAYCLIPENEVAWHAGDGANGMGNCETVAIEICVNKDGNFSKSRQNAAELAARILHGHGIKKVVDGTKSKSTGNIFQHNTFSSYGKNCPQNIREKGLWNGFVLDTQNILDALWGTKSELLPYRVRLTANDVKSQIGAFNSLDNAISFAKSNPGYRVFNGNGEEIINN